MLGFDIVSVLLLFMRISCKFFVGWLFCISVILLLDVVFGSLFFLFSVFRFLFGLV